MDEQTELRNVCREIQARISEYSDAGWTDCIPTSIHALVKRAGELTEALGLAKPPVELFITDNGVCCETREIDGLLEYRHGRVGDDLPVETWKRVKASLGPKQAFSAPV